MFPDRSPQTLLRTALQRDPINIRVPAPVSALLLSLTLLLMAHPSRATADGLESGGAVQGTVRITKKLTAQRMRFRLYPGFRPAPPQAEPVTAEDEYRNLVVYLKSGTPLAAVEAAGAQKFRMAQQGETFIPHVLPIPVGSTVEFPNLDPIFHNVFSLSATRTFDLGRYPKGESKLVTFGKAGVVPVFCHIHSDMSAIIMVLENSYFTTPDSDHRYRIGDIPPGSYTVVAWHERAKPVETEVEVEEGRTLELNITVPIEDEESAPP